MTRRERDLLKVWIIQRRKRGDKKGLWEAWGHRWFISKASALQSVSDAGWIDPLLEYRAVLYMPEGKP